MIKREETNMIIFEILGLLTFIGIALALGIGFMWLCITAMVNVMIWLESRGKI